MLADKPVRAPEFPVWANRTAAPYPPDPDAVRAGLAAQIGAPVAFAAQIEAMYEAGARIFVEAGPGTVLTRLVGQILGDRPHRAVACEPRADSGLTGWLDALARLAVAGQPVRTVWLFQGRDAVDALRTPAPKRPGWTVDGHLVRTADGALLPGAPRAGPTRRGDDCDDRPSERRPRRPGRADLRVPAHQPGDDRRTAGRAAHLLRRHDPGAGRSRGARAGRGARAVRGAGGDRGAGGERSGSRPPPRGRPTLSSRIPRSTWSGSYGRSSATAPATPST